MIESRHVPLAVSSGPLPSSDTMCRFRFSSVRHAFLVSLVALASLAGLPPSLVQPAWAQSAPAAPAYRPDTWNAQNGLRGDLVLGKLLRSPDGYLWMRTAFGLTRFDGLTFTTFNADNSPIFATSAASQRPLLVDRRGRLWIATSTGLVWYQDGQFHHGPTYTGGMLSLAEDSRGRFWGTMTTGGVMRSTRGGDGVERMEAVSLDGFASSEAYGVAADGSGAIWIGFAPGGAVRVAQDDEGRDEVRRVTTRDGLGSDRITAVAQGIGGSVWLAGDGHITRVHDGRFVTFPLPRELRDAHVFDVAEDADGSAWTATEGAGLLRYDPRGRLLQQVRSQDGLSHDRVLSAFVDPHGSVWAATVQGLNRLRRVPFSSVTALPSLPVLAPGCMVSDERGRAWIDSENGPLFTGRLADVDSFTPIAKASRTRHLSIATGRGDRLWIVTTGGEVVQSTEAATRPFVPPSGQRVSEATSVFEDRRGALWIGVGNGLRRVQADQERLFTERDGLHGPNVHHYVDAEDGVVWAGGTEGLTRIEGETLRSWRGTPGGTGAQALRAVLALLRDRTGTIWVGTQTGLTRVVDAPDGPRFATVRTGQGLPENWINDIIDDGRGDLWLLGLEGITRVPLAELHAVADGRKARLDSVAVFGIRDGLPSAPIAAGGNCPRIVRDESGRLWFSLARGLAVVDPAHMPVDATTPLAHVVEARIDGATVPFAETLSLPAGARRLELRYTGVDLRAGESVRFQHRLDGFDPDWVDAGTARLVSYTNLRPGSYSFNLRARNTNGVWSPRAATLGIAVQPPLYRTWWFVAMVGTTLLGLAWLAHRMRERVIRARFDSVLAERQRVAREMHDTLLSGVAGVALRLDAASQRAQNASQPLASELAEIRNITRQMLLDARRAVGDLRGAREEGELASSLAAAAQGALAGSGIDLRCDLSARLDAYAPDVQRQIIRIVQEAVTNARKHSDGTHLTLVCDETDERLRIRVEDNGRGLDDAADGNPAGHWGVIGMHERAREIGATLSVDGRPGSGTVVTLTLPRSARPRASASSA